MKIYVDEIPKTCDECKLKQVINKTKDGLYTSYQCPFKDGELAFGDNPYRRKCPLHPVAEREAEVRKEVVGEIRKLAQTFISSKDFSLCNHEYANGLCYGLQYELSKILDRVERGE